MAQARRYETASNLCLNMSKCAPLILSHLKVSPSWNIISLFLYIATAAPNESSIFCSFLSPLALDFHRLPAAHSPLHIATLYAALSVRERERERANRKKGLPVDSRKLTFSLTADVTFSVHIRSEFCPKHPLNSLQYHSFPVQFHCSNSKHVIWPNL